ncbi:caspase family protein [Methylocella tundrae]|uniref:caspase family protein n=1 Tax=Methylocella tundrae TaxID=227605 RepID=UPI0030FE26E2|nr:caspase family protein [Methylocella tundrae]
MSLLSRFSMLLRHCLVASLIGVPAAFAAPPAVVVENPKEVHAIVVGVDQYQHLARLKGAAADARDIETSLRAMGVQDVTALYDDKADRDSILKNVDDLSARIRPGDLVILSIAGHGAQEPERVKGSEADGKDAVFLLAGFDTAGAGTRQRILDKEFNHLIKAFESRGARVLFVADTCSGGGLAREVDPRGSEMIYRSVPTYAISDDELKPVSTPSDAFATELDFTRTIFLAAVDKNSKAPEIKVPGVDGYRGALSYALARALEGAADANGDGKITIEELFAYVRQLTYQLSDQRQTIVSASAPRLDVNTEPVVELSRSVTFVTPPGSAPSAVAANIPLGGAARATPAGAPPPFPPQRPVRVAVLDGSSAQLADVTPLESRFEAVAPNQNPELIWDPKSGDVISGGDVIAREVGKDELPGVIDRAAAVRALKQMAARSVQPILLLPDNKVHHLGSQVEVAIDQLSNRSLLLFNLAGDGTVQLLYPQNESEAELMNKPEYRLPIKVRGPFGADQIVAITAPERMPQLEQALGKLNARRTAGQLVRILSQYADAGMRLGSVGVFTAP